MSGQDQKTRSAHTHTHFPIKMLASAAEAPRPDAVVSVGCKRKLPDFLFSNNMRRKQRDLKWVTYRINRWVGSLCRPSYDDYCGTNMSILKNMFLRDNADRGGAKGVLADDATPEGDVFDVLVQTMLEQLPRLMFHGVPGRCIVPPISELTKLTRSRVAKVVIPSFIANAYFERLVDEGPASVVPGRSGCVQKPLNTRVTDLKPAVLDFLPSLDSIRKKAGQDSSAPSCNNVSLEMIARFVFTSPCYYRVHVCMHAGYRAHACMYVCY